MILSIAGRRALAAAVLILLVLTVGTSGYIILGLSLLEAIYQTAITVTTVGFSEITPNGDPASTRYRLFTIALVLTGTTAVLFAAGVFIESVVASRLGPYQEKRMQREIDKLSGHLIVCGYGRVGNAVVQRAADLGGGVVIIDSDEERLHASRRLHIIGDATSDSVLRNAGILRANALVAALSSDASNLFLAVSARQLNPDLRLVSRANASDSAEKLRTIGMDSVVEPYEMAGARLATAALRPHASDYFDQVFSQDSDKVELAEVKIYEGATLVGSAHTVAEIACGVVVVAIRPHGHDDFVGLAAHAQALAEGDVIIALGDRESIGKLSTMALAL